MALGIYHFVLVHMLNKYFSEHDKYSLVYTNKFPLNWNQGIYLVMVYLIKCFFKNKQIKIVSRIYFNGRIKNNYKKTINKQHNKEK